MSTTVTAQFKTRRAAEMSVERLVQEHGIERTDIFIAAAGPDNTVGVERAGSDTEGKERSADGRDDAALNGAIEVSVDLEDDELAAKVRDAFAEFQASDVEED
ncbi:MAG: hypothetical protein ABW026_12740 [Microvirga sp.]